MFGDDSGSDETDIRDARCPKCGASAFAAISDVYTESVIRLEDGGESSPAARAGSMTDAQIVRELAPPRRKSVLGVVLAVAVPLAAVAYYVYRRFGEIPGQSTAVAAGVVAIVVLMTKLRSYSDKFYHARQAWNHGYICRRCGHRVAEHA